MDVTTITQDHRCYLKELSNRDFHLVTFAEDGESIFSTALRKSFLISRREVSRYCDIINQSKETGTIWPKADVTAIPMNFCRETLDRPRALRTCIRDTFVANRDYCMSSKMVFDFTGGVLNTEAIEDEIIDFAMGEFNRSPLEEVEIRFDQDPGGFC